MKEGTSRHIWKAGSGIAGLVILLIILAAVNMLLSRARLRADLTEENLYTLSEGTRNIVGDLDRTVTLKFFFNRSSREVPVFLKSYAQQVEDLLREYQMLSHGKIAVEKYDPRPDSEAEDWAHRYGIRGQQLSMMGPVVYFGLVAVAGDSEAVLPTLDPRNESLLEYDVTRLIYRAVHPKKPAVGVLSTLPVLGRSAPPYAMPGQPQPETSKPWFGFEDLRRDFDIREIRPDAEEIDPTLQALVIVHPKNLSEATVYAIDQFLLQGGRLLVFLDPLSVADIQRGEDPYGGGGFSSNLSSLLSAWGVGFNPKKVVADPASASRVQGMDNQIQESMVWLTLRKDRLDKDDILTAQLEAMAMAYAGSFSDNTTDGISFTPLIKTSPSAASVDAMTAQFGEAAVRRNFQPSGVALPLAARLSGMFHTAFPDGKPEAPAEEQTEKEASAKPAGPAYREGESTVILVGDVDMLIDALCVREVPFFGFTAHEPLNDNLTFLANAVEQIAGSSDLIGIRSRGQFVRPFTRVLALENRARKEWQARERDLTARLEEAQRHLQELQSQKDQNQKFILSPEQKKAIERFRKEELRISRQLKEVRKNLRRDIERLGMKVKIINIALIPILVALAGIVFAIYRRKKTQ